MKFFKLTLFFVIVAGFFTATGKVSAQTTLDEIINDMILPHEGRPHGVPESFDWAIYPRRGAPEPGEGWTAAIAWGQVYEWAEGNPATNTRIHIKDLAMYYLSKSDNQWHLLQQAVRVAGANYVENFAGDVNKPANFRVETGGSISITCGDGYNYHFWPNTGRVTIPVNDVAGCFVTVKARLIKDKPEGVDDTADAKYLMSVGGDWWLSLTAPWDNWTTNWDIGIGRFRFITPEWKSFNMYSVSEEVMRENPPPFPLATGVDSGTVFEENQNLQLVIFPNPVSAVAKIKFHVDEYSPTRVLIFDSTLRLVETLFSKDMHRGYHELEWDTSPYPQGLYFIHLEQNAQRFARKFIVSR